MKKLSADDLAELQDLLSHPALQLFLAEIDSLTDSIERDVLKLCLESVDEKQLFLRKAHGEGARKLRNSISARIQSLKAKA